mgnify:CR=1 FL=1
MSFLNYLKENESEIIEAAGALSGLPKHWIDEITNKSNNGGENSEIILYKANAKVKDLTDACKMVGGFVASSDRGRRSYSRAEIKAQADKEANAAVLVKVNSEWAFLAKWSDWTGEGNKKFELFTIEGSKTVRDTWVNRTRYGTTYNDYNRKHFSGAELIDIINFSENKIDVYLITADVERIAKRQERETVNFVDKKAISPEKRKAIIQFLDKKADGLITVMKKEVEESFAKINLYVETTVKKAVTGADIKTEVNFDEEVKKLKAKLSEINTIGYYVADIIKDGGIKDSYYNDRKSYSYTKFLEIVKTFSEEKI